MKIGKMKMCFEIGKNIAHHRKLKKISQSQLALILNTNQNKISRWEIGELIPNIYDTVKIAKALEITIEDLIK